VDYEYSSETMNIPFEAHRTFEPHERSVGEARWFVRDVLDEWGLAELKDPATLAVSELVTNAVVHAGTRATVALAVVDGALRLEVTDFHTDRALPLQTEMPAHDAESGRGLLITSALAPSWGVEYTRSSKSVWLSFALTTSPARVAENGGGATETGQDGSPIPEPRSPAAEVGAHDALGLRDEALSRLGLDEYLDLAVERARDAVGADATYLMLARDFDQEYEVRATSGLDATLRGTRFDIRSPGTPNLRNPHLPVVIPDLDLSPVPLLAGTSLRSLVLVPVTVDGRVTGALVAASSRAGGLADEQAVVLQRVADTMAVAADRARLRQSERERRGWFSFIAVAGDLLAGSLDQRMTMAITGQIIVPQLADWCAIYLDDERHRPRLQHVWHHDENLNDPLRAALAATPPERVRDSEDALLSGDVHTVPLVARAQQIGVLVLGRDSATALTGEMLLVTESVVRRAALAIDNARAHGDLQAVGEALQRSLLPPSMPNAPGLDVGVVYEAAGGASPVGGDFYDLFGVGGGRWCFAVGDVCGTGAEAAAVTGLARHTIRALALAGFPASAILERLNTAILDEGERSRFLTLVLGFLEPSSGGRFLMTLVCAGHPPPFLVGADGEVRQLGRPQSLLGVVDGVQFTGEEHILERGDLLVTVTDGVLERRDGHERMLEEDGLSAELRQVRGLGAQTVAERIRRLVLGFSADPQTDDMAVLAIRLGRV
jgi:serine phosphatase RsbU (regulator of sigma subunit)/anti-sigma regulatory factor (Ser/Thr protein kinase)